MMHVAFDGGRSLLIGGRWEAASNMMAMVSAWSGEALGEVACADTGHVDRAVASAVAGAEGMRALSTGARARILHDAAQALERNADRFAAAITAETGKPIRSAGREVARAVNTLAAYSPTPAPHRHAFDLSSEDEHEGGERHTLIRRRSSRRVRLSTSLRIPAR